MYELGQTVFCLYEEKDSNGKYRWRLKRDVIVRRTVEEELGKEPEVNYEAKGFWFLQGKDIFAIREEAEAEKRRRNSGTDKRVAEIEEEIRQQEGLLERLRAELEART